MGQHGMIKTWQQRYCRTGPYRKVIPREERSKTLCLFIRLSTTPFDFFSDSWPLADLYTDAIVVLVGGRIYGCQKNSVLKKFGRAKVARRKAVQFSLWLRTWKCRTCCPQELNRNEDTQRTHGRIFKIRLLHYQNCKRSEYILVCHSNRLVGVVRTTLCWRIPKTWGNSQLNCSFFHITAN